MQLYVLGFLALPFSLLAQNVGIGISNPTSLLHVGNGTVRLEGPSATGGTSLSLGGYGDIKIDAFGTVGGRFVIKENGRVGIGVPLPFATLDVKTAPGAEATANFHGSAYTSIFNAGPDEHTYIRAGIGNRYVILNDIPGGRVGVGLSNPSEVLDVAGAVKASNYKLSSPKTYYYSVTPAAFTARNNTVAVQQNLGVYLSTSGTYTDLVAPVNLPHGATVTSLTAHLIDNSATTDFTLVLGRYASDGFAGNMHLPLTSTGTPGYHVLQTATLTFPLIDNSIYSYVISVYSHAGNWPGTDLKVRSIIIEYTLPEL